MVGGGSPSPVICKSNWDTLALAKEISTSNLEGRTDSGRRLAVLSPSGVGDIDTNAGITPSMHI